MDKRMYEEQLPDTEMPGGETTAQELGEVLGETAQQEAAQEPDESEALAASIREGIGVLFEDGWTVEELKAFSMDEGAQADIAAGRDVIRAACAYLKRGAAERPRRRGVPTVTRAAAGAAPEENRIEQMSDAQFREFSRRAHAAMMEGRKVRI